jgi:cytoskeletal protein CcmA (bactofilin family)
MWRKQEEPKAAPSLPEASMPHKVEPLPAPVPPTTTFAREAFTPTGHLTRGLTIKGEITGNEDLFVDGEVHGQIRLRDSKVTVGASGRLTASIEAREIVVRGKIKGDLRARERVQIVARGSVIGDVIARHLSIDEGAEIRGNVDTTRGEERHGQRSSAMVAGAGLPPTPMHAKEFRHTA